MYLDVLHFIFHSINVRHLLFRQILNASPQLESINAANNLLFVVNGDSHVKHLRLKYLNLSGNKLTVLTGASFISFPNL